MPIPHQQRAQVVLFGDSITQQGFSPGGWTARLADALQRRADVINRGYSGYNTRWARAIMPHVLLSQHLSLVVVFFGANDAADPKGLCARQHVALEEYQANLDAIYEHVSRSSDCCVFVTPPPVDDVARLQYVQSEYDPSATAPERTHALAAAYAQACKAWAAQRNVACFDAHGFMTEKEDWRSFLWDGLHFSARGNKVFFEGLSAFLEQAWGKGLQEFGGLDAPWNAEIDGEGDWEGSISRWYSNGEEEGKTT